MAGTQFVNMTALDPNQTQLDLQLQLQRNQAIQQMMQQEAMTPVQSSSPTAPVSWTQGLAKMLQGYAARKSQDKSIDLEKRLISGQSDAMRSLFFGNQGTPAAAPSGPAATPQPLALAPPAADPNEQSVQPLVQRDPGQTLADALAPRQTGAPAPGGPQLPQTAPVGPAASQGGSPLPSLTGDRTRDYLIATQVGMPKYLELASAQFAPTDQAKNDIRVGITPQMRKQMDLRDSVKQTMLPNAPGVVDVDPNTGQPVYRQLSGLPQAIGLQKAEETAGTASQTPHYVPDPFHPGQERTIYPTPPLMQGQGAPGPQPGPQAGPQPGPGPIGPGAPSPMIGGGNTAGALEGQKLGAGKGQEFAAKLTDDADSALQGKRTLGEMQNLLQGFNPGAFAPVLGGLGAVAQSMGVNPDVVQNLTNINPGDAQAFQKGTAALAAESAKQMTNRITQQEFKVYLANNPNWMMQPDGIKRVMDYMGKGFDQTLDKQAAFQQFSQSAAPDRWHIDFPAYWNKTQRDAIATGKTNSVPANLTQVRTRSDVNAGPAPVYQEGQTATDPRTGAKFVFQGGHWGPAQ